MLDLRNLGVDEAKAINRAALTAFLGHGKIPLPKAASATAIPERTIRSYMDGDHPIPDHGQKRLTQFLGPDYTNIILQPLGQGGAYSLGVPERDSVNPMSLNVACSALSAMIAEDASDLVIDHCEILNRLPDVRRLARLCGHYLAVYSPLERATPSVRIRAA